jgi:hypothetical protein
MIAASQIGFWLMVVMLGCAVPPTSEPASAEPPPAPVVDEAAAVDPVEELLDRLERSADDLSGFKATILYVKESALLGRKEIRRGELIYQLDVAGDKRFALFFDQLQIGSRLERRQRNYVFDGRWLAEIDHENKQFIKREIVPPGEHLDPLKLGEGPFPLPVGQAKADVRGRFDVEPALLPEEGPLSRLQDVDGLRLVPKPQRPEAEEYELIDLFYDRATLLPVGIVAVEVNGDRKIVRLDDAQRNPPLDEADRARLSIDEPDPTQWHVYVTPWEREGGR